jgi:hypothetical protein
VPQSAAAPVDDLGVTQTRAIIAWVVVVVSVSIVLLAQSGSTPPVSSADTSASVAALR